MVMVVRLEHPRKVSFPMHVTEFGITTEVRPEQSEKAASPIFVAELEMLIEMILMHPPKALSPMLVTELGMVTEVRPEHP
jgi:hypothetical protein